MLSPCLLKGVLFAIYIVVSQCVEEVVAAAAAAATLALALAV